MNYTIMIQKVIEVLAIIPQLERTTRSKSTKNFSSKINAKKSKRKKNRNKNKSNKKILGFNLIFSSNNKIKEEVIATAFKESISCRSKSNNRLKFSNNSRTSTFNSNLS